MLGRWTQLNKPDCRPALHPVKPEDPWPLGSGEKGMPSVSTAAVTASYCTPSEACQASLSFSISQSLLKLISIELVPGESPWTEEPGGLQFIGLQSQTQQHTRAHLHR